MEGFWNLTLHVGLGFVTLILIVRIIGNKQLGQMNVFTYISGIVIGSMIADTILHPDLAISRTMMGVSLWTIFLHVFEWISLKSIRAREILDGQPTIVIRDGKIVCDALKKERLNLDDLTMMLRTNAVFNMADVAYAICEPNGDLSVLKKQSKEVVIRDDLNMTSSTTQLLPTSIVVDGRLIEKNLKALNLTESVVKQELEKVGITSQNSIFYAEVQSDGKLFVQTKGGEIQLIEM